QYAGARTADAPGVREGVFERVAGRVLMYRYEPRHAAPLLEHLAHAMPGRLRRYQADVDLRGGNVLLVADVESVGEHQGLALLELRGDLLPVQLGLAGVRSEDHDDVRLAGGVGHRYDPEAGRLGLLAAL